MTERIGNKKCHIYRSGGSAKVMPVFYWGIAKGDEEIIMTVMSYLKEQIDKIPFLLVAYEVEDWNDAFSPWEADAVFGKEGFGGKASGTLKWLVECCMPYIESDKCAHIRSAETLLRFPTGYSLAGLFSLWAYFEKNLFDGAVSCSGSLWFNGWTEYVEEYGKSIDLLETQKKQHYIYLSLGEKEEKTKNAKMASVGDNTRELYRFLSERTKQFQCVLKWNKGGHFSEPELRIAKGIEWVLQKVFLFS